LGLAVAVAFAFAVLVTVRVVVDAVAVVRLVNKTVEAVDVVVVRTVEVALEAWRLQAALMIEAGNDSAAGVCSCSARFAGICVEVETKVVMTWVLTRELAAGTMVERMMLVGLTTTVAVEVGALNPSSVEQNPWRVDEPMMLEAEATAQGIAGPPEEVALVKV
jgi:hypothetical protein